jgi:hypothetical protein
MRFAPSLAAALAAAFIAPALAQEPFDACAVFTQEDAEKALGAAAVGESVNSKKRPRVVTQCSYSGVKDGKPVTASAQFRVLRNSEEAERAFDEARLQHQTKPLLLSGAEAFWAGKSGVMHVRKGKAWVVLTVGPAKHAERDVNEARKLAELLVQKL